MAEHSTENVAASAPLPLEKCNIYEPPCKQKKQDETNYSPEPKTAEHEEKGEDIPDKYPEDQPLPISMNALFTKSNAVSEQAFWNFHPNQPKEGIPFNSKLTYFRKDISGRCVQRKWLSYNNEKQALYCSFCVMYAPEKSRKNQLIQGCSDWRHITVRIAEHEKSQCHQQSREVYFVNI